MADDAAAFCDADAMPGCESVVYTPRSGSPRTISVQVFRGGYRLIDGTLTATESAIDVFARYHATAGVNNPVDTQGDAITVAHLPGQTPVSHTIQAIDPGRSDAGGVYLILT